MFGSFQKYVQTWHLLTPVRWPFKGGLDGIMLEPCPALSCLQEWGEAVRTPAAGLFVGHQQADLANLDCTSVVVVPNPRTSVQCKCASGTAHHRVCFLHSVLEMSTCTGRMWSRQRTLLFWESKLGISSLQTSIYLTLCAHGHRLFQ